MKKAAIITGAIGVIILVLSLFFKLHHWSGADYLLVLGTVINCIIALPLIAIFLFKGNLQNKNIYLFGTISGFILYVGIVFKIEHYPFSNIIQAVGTLLFIIFIILVALNLYKSRKE